MGLRGHCENIAPAAACRRQDYRELLFQDDQDLLEWIMGRSAILEDRFVPGIEEIRRFHGIGA